MNMGNQVSLGDKKHHDDAPYIIRLPSSQAPCVKMKDVREALSYHFEKTGIRLRVGPMKEPKGKRTTCFEVYVRGVKEGALAGAVAHHLMAELDWTDVKRGLHPKSELRLYIDKNWTVTHRGTRLPYCGDPEYGLKTCRGDEECAPHRRTFTDDRLQIW